MAESRDQWGSQLDFILSCLGYAVGLGNVWRFPYLCGRNGGAAFLIPYVIMLVFAGLPTFYMELAIGQYAQLTPLMLYRRMSPIFTGIGYCMMMISILTGVYYNVIMAWSIRYLFSSFTSRLPWYDCQSSWNTIHCFDDRWNVNCTNHNLTFFNNSCVDIENNLDMEILVNQTYNASKTSPAEEYLNIEVLALSDGLGTIGLPKWDLVLCLLLAWIVVFACLIKGVKSAGKVVYFTATFPYLLLVILLIRGCTLPGAMRGIKFYMIPDLNKLKEAGVWGDAAIQIFFSLSLGGGGLTTLASYNKFNNNLFRDTLIVVFGNCLTSIFAGFVIFPILGFMSHTTGRTVADLAASGPGLAFIAYPDALTRIPVAPLWAILFFFMLVLLGIDSQLVIVEVAITCLLDKFPKLRKMPYKPIVVGGICTASFLVGLCMVCPGGPYILNLFDTFAGGWPLVMACLAEICMVSWVYGLPTFIDDIYMMLGRPKSMGAKLIGYPVNWYWKANWLVFSPILLTFVLLFNWIFYERTKYGDYVYPNYGEGIGWALALLCVGWIPLMAVVMVIYVAVKKKPWSYLWKPTAQWGPGDETAARESMENNMTTQNKSPSETDNRAYENIAFSDRRSPSAASNEDKGMMNSVNSGVTPRNPHHLPSLNRVSPGNNEPPPPYDRNRY